VAAASPHHIWQVLLIALELGIEELLSRKGLKDINMVEKIKVAGYNIKIRYKMFEIDL